MTAAMCKVQSMAAHLRNAGKQPLSATPVGKTLERKRAVQLRKLSRKSGDARDTLRDRAAINSECAIILQQRTALLNSATGSEPDALRQLCPSCCRALYLRWVSPAAGTPAYAADYRRLTTCAAMYSSSGNSSSSSSSGSSSSSSANVAARYCEHMTCNIQAIDKRVAVTLDAATSSAAGAADGSSSSSHTNEQESSSGEAAL
jgi:hypothetical protein